MVLHAFADGTDGAGPAASLVFDPNGNLFGTTAVATNRSAQGNVFRMRAPTREDAQWAFSVLYTFTGSPDGAQPGAKLFFDDHGNLYSTTLYGGTGSGCGVGGCGTVFEVSPP